ncbi:MAG: phytoene/squalene synthase family protein [Candidatus Sericytochromatia bacterium]
MSMPSDDAQALQVLQQHARSFSWGGFFLPRPQLLAAARLYHFCRVCDDLVDEAGDPAAARLALQDIDAALDLPAQPSQPLFLRAFLETVATTGMKPRFARDLLSGLRQDLGEVTLPTRAALLRYCYRVAGTVGGLMSPILGVKAEEALPFAVDLGIAMQLTNICRDVGEDAANGRVYLPADLLAAHGLHPDQLRRGEVSSARLEPVLRELLALAERYYQSGYQGMDYIPSRTRFAIWVAARLYQGIGRKIARSGYAVLETRVHLTRGEKLREVGRAALAFFGAADPPQDQLHSRELHQALAGECPCCQRALVEAV